MPMEIAAPSTQPFTQPEACITLLVSTCPQAALSVCCSSVSVSQVLVALDGFKSAPPAAEADLAPVQKLINEAYQGAC